MKRHQRRACCGYEQRLPWCQTEEAAPWISQQLGLLVFHIAGTVLCIALCWCWQYLLTVGGNWLPHIVIELDVTLWHGAVDRPRTFYKLQNATQQHCQHQSDSGQQESSMTDIAMKVAVVCVLKCISYDIIW